MLNLSPIKKRFVKGFCAALLAAGIQYLSGNLGDIVTNPAFLPVITGVLLALEKRFVKL